MHEVTICYRKKILVLQIQIALGNTHIVGKSSGKYSIYNVLGNLPAGIVATELPKVPCIFKLYF